MDSIDDRRRYEVMYRAAYPVVLRYCQRRLPEEAARDAAADVFLVAWRRFDEVPEPALPWLLRTAALTVKTGRRGADRAGRLVARAGTAGTPRDVPDHADAVAQRLRVREALARLPEQDRELLMLTCWDDLDAGTAAQLLGCSRVAVRVRLHRARKRLAALLDTEPAPDAAPVIAPPPLTAALPEEHR